MGWTAAAEAAEHGLAVTAAERGLAVGRWHAAVGADAGVDLAGGAAVPRVSLPARIGLSDGFEVFFAPIARTEAPHLHDPALGARLRLRDGDVEVAVSAAGDLAVFEPPVSASAEAGPSLRWHATDRVALDAGVLLRLGLVPDVVPGARVPLGAVCSVTRSLAISASSGLTVAATDPVAVAVPLALRGAFTLARGDAPLLELGAGGGWTDLGVPEALAITAGATLFL